MQGLPRFCVPLNNDGFLEEADHGSRRRILLLTQYFPPYAEVGAARWEGFAPYLTNAGWGLDIVMESPSDPTYTDWSRFRKLPRGVRVVACERRRPAWSRVFHTLGRTFSPNGAAALSDITPPTTSVSDDKCFRNKVR